MPEKLGHTLIDFTNSYSEFLQHNPEHSVQETIAQEFFFAALNYQRIAEIFDQDFCVDMQTTGNKEEILTLRNLIPARQLAARLSFAHSACFFSATLHPAYYYQTLLGLPENSVHIKVPSPFSAHQLDVKIANNLSTRYKDRQAALHPLCDIIQQQLQKSPGNALVFFSSYEFLQQAEQQLRKRFIQQDIQLLVQSRRMNEQDRENFIAQFNQHNNLLGLAVLGGVFSEGVDLAGDALKGAFIATLGLPQINPVNEYLRSVMQEQFGQGYDFTYTYPGIQKVIQAAGESFATNLIAAICGYWISALGRHKSVIYYRIGGNFNILPPVSPLLTRLWDNAPNLLPRSVSWPASRLDSSSNMAKYINLIVKQLTQ